MRKTILALVIGLFLAVGLAAPTPTRAVTSDLKVVIVVGPVGTMTADYRKTADQAANDALQYTSNVVRIYSPNATWAAVKPALQGANVVIYLGHGNGFPSPYTSTLMQDRQDGMGLNTVAGSDADSNLTYYGESVIASQVQLAPNALVILSHLCYASGNSEPGTPDPTVSVAHQRIDNFSAGFIAAGAAAVIAESFWDPGAYFPLLFGTDEPLAQAWATMQYAHGNVVSFGSSRTPGFDAYSDPDTPSGGYHRSLVVLPGLTTGAILTGWSDDSRLAGPDRFATAAAISAATFSPGVPVAYIATGYNFPDALAGAAVAGNLGGPVLLVTPTSIPDVTATELGRLKPAKIVVLGSSSVVSDAVLGALKTYTAGSVTRLAGPDRFATAAAISAATFSPGVPVAYIATGYNFPDALAGAAVAGNLGGPVLLVTPTSIPDVTATELGRLKPAKIVVLGSSGVVSMSVLAQLAAFVPH